VTVPVDSTDAPVDSLGTPVAVTAAERITKFTLGGGGGRFYRELRFSECSSPNSWVPFEQEYADVGVEVDAQISDKGHVGIRGGYIFGDTELAGVVDPSIPEQLEIFYVNPYFSHSREEFGFGLGGLISSAPLQTGDGEDFPPDDREHLYPTGYIRFGSLSRFYFSGHLFEGVPLYSGGGVFIGGGGFRPVKWLELYAAYCSAGPYQHESALGRVTVDLNRNWTVMSTFRFPVEYKDQPDDEYGVSIGVSYRHYRNQD
jgi:hypothetical protein